MTFARSIAATAIVLGALFATGCGDGKPARVPVSGKVLIDDQPLTKGYIRFVPAKGRPAGAEIGPDGSFKLGTYDEKNPDGAVPGDYSISVTSVESAGSNAQKWLVPQKYNDHQTSELTQKIVGPQNDLVIKLTWEGQKPVVEKLPNEGVPLQ